MWPCTVSGLIQVRSLMIFFVRLPWITPWHLPDLSTGPARQATFCFLSGQGADQTEKSRMAFARYKGAAETALLDIGFPRVHIFRPGYIYPVTPRKEPNLVYTISRFLYPLLRRLYPNIGIPSEDLARAMVHAGIYGTGGIENPILENKDIRFMEGL